MKHSQKSNRRSRLVAIANHLYEQYKESRLHPFVNAVFQDSHEAPTYPNMYVTSVIGDRIVFWNIFTDHLRVVSNDTVLFDGIDRDVKVIEDAQAFAELV